MKRRLLVLLMSAIAFAALPLYADQYRVTVKLDPGEDAAAVARRLAATYRGELERPVEVAVGTFSMSIAMGPRQAELLARDPHVETVQSAADVPVASPAPRPPEALAVQSWSSGDYRYDGSGNIRRIGTDVYVYDGASRVVRADAGPTHRQQYAYDGFGNLHTVITDAPVNATDVSPYRARIAINPETNRAEYPGTESGQPNPIDPLTAQPYTMAAQYDASGRVTSLIHKTDTFEYDALDMVKKAKVDGQWRAYVYNASNERIGTIGLSGQANGTDTGSDWTLRDTGGQVLRRLSRSSTGAWSWKEDYIYRGSQLLAAEVTGPEKVRHFHLDHLGTPRLITGNGGVELPPEGMVPMSRHTYYAFGAETGLATAGEKQFTGHERDAATLDYMHARYYSPQMGRFLSVDPVLDVDRALRKPQSWNRYVYVENNPISHTDPTGKVLDTIVDVGSIAYDLFDIGRSLYRSEGVSKTQGIALLVDVGATIIPFVTGAGAAVRAASKADDIAKTAVYVSRNADNVVQYVGITNNLTRRAAEHAATKGIEVTSLKGLEKLGRADARAVEQTLIEIHKLSKDGGTLMNKINSVAKTNKKYAESLERGYKLLNDAGYVIK